MLKDLTVVLSEVAVDDDGQPYSTTRVYRFDFQGTHEDLEKIFHNTPRLFVEGGQMKNEV